VNIQVKVWNWIDYMSFKFFYFQILNKKIANNCIALNHNLNLLLNPKLTLLLMLVVVKLIILSNFSFKIFYFCI
jgi:hypothetical protein